MNILIYLNGDLTITSDARVKRLKMMALGLKENGIKTSFVYNIGHNETKDEEWWTDENDFRCKALFYKKRKGIADKIIPNNLRPAKSLLTFLSNNNNKYDIVLLYNSAMSSYIPVLNFCRSKNIKCLADLTEWYPLSIMRMLSVNFWDNFFFRNFKLNKYDGIIAISSFWERFASKKTIPTIRVPSLCNPNDTRPMVSSPANSVFQLVYLGGLSDRDLPYTMIDGVKLAAKKDIPIRLTIIGNIDRQKAGRKIKKLVKADPILKKLIYFTGFIEDNEMNDLLNTASANILLRGDNDFSNGCFPTRLPEYLLTAQPLITSAIHDFKLYFEDKKNACLLTPGDEPQELCDAIEYLFKNEEESKLIGERGRESALHDFSLSLYGIKMKNFIKQFSLNTKYRKLG